MLNYDKTGYSAKLESGKVLVEEKDHVFTQHVSTKDHTWLADEPLEAGGNNLGPDPYDHILAGLGACTSMTLRMYASRKELPLEHVKVELEHTRDYNKDGDNGECTQNLEAIIRKITLRGDLTAAQRKRLLEIANKCPVYKTLHNGLLIVSELVE